MRVLNRAVRQLILRTVPQVMVLILFVGVSTVMFAQPAQALSLKKTVRTLTRPVKTLLSPIVKPSGSDSASKPQASTPEPSQSTVSTPQVSTDSSTSSTEVSEPKVSAEETVVSTPTTIRGGGLETDSSLGSMETLDNGLAPDSAVTLQLASARASHASATPAMTNLGILQATENGWQLFGVLWYWWAGCVGLIASLFVWREQVLRGLLLGKQKLL